MESFEFRTLAIQSASRYYQYLVDYNKGFSEYPVQNVQQAEDFYFLKTRVNLRGSLDSLRIRVGNEIFDQDQIQLLHLDESGHVIKIRINAALHPHLQASLRTRLLCEQIYILSDLRFLVRRVENWYRDSEDPLILPKSPSVFDDSLLPLSLSEEQRTAVISSESSPLSYIWGAPGTGKTQAVLSHAVLSHYKNGERVLIVAPTNNAIEQTLLGLFSTMESEGVDIQRVYRLGTPSADFASRYPNVCEMQGIDEKLSELNSEIEHLCAEINSLQEQLPLFLERRSFEQALSRANVEHALLSASISDLTEQHKTETKLSAAAKKSVSDLLLQQQRTEQILSNTRCMIDVLEKQSADLHKKLKNIFVRTFSNRTSDNEAKLLEIARDLDGYYAQENTLNAQLDGLSSRISSLEVEQAQHASSASLLLDQITTKVKERASLKKRIDSLSDSINSIHITYTEAEFDRINELRISLSKKQAKLQQLLSYSPSRLASSALILAVTLDGCIHRFSAKEEANRIDPLFFRIYLDEAAYASLIKAASLLSFSSPITLFGDHLQLPPICEMDPHDDDPVTLFQIPSIYLAELFHSSFYEICSDFRSFKNPEHIPTYHLSRSYRFGPELAGVLSRRVYRFTLSGNPNVQTQVYVCNCPHVNGDQARQSTSEADKAISLATNLNARNEKFSILTPYRKQLQLIRSGLSPDLHDSLLTIHGAQGREWDTVILSVVDSRPDFFTSSQKIPGLYVLNTAISRARKRLILLCDSENWQLYSDQLITDLLNLALPL